MARLIDKATRIEAAGNKPKLIDEIVGRVNTHTPDVSIAHMRSPAGWLEPAQTPGFREITYVLAGTLRVETADGRIDVTAGQGIVTEPGERVRYSTPVGDAEYIAVCLPAFSPDTVHREDDA